MCPESALLSDVLADLLDQAILHQTGYDHTQIGGLIVGGSLVLKLLACELFAELILTIKELPYLCI